MTQTLPVFLAECPDYRWNADTQMFDATVYRNGELVMSFAIPRPVFYMIARRVTVAIREAQLADQRAAKLIQMQAE